MKVQPKGWTFIEKKLVNKKIQRTKIRKNIENELSRSWIAPAEDMGAAAIYFYKDVDLGGRTVSKATLYVCGIGYHHVKVNGADTTDHCLAPMHSSYHKRCYYEEIDVTGKFVSGKNEIEISVGQGWRRVYSPVYSQLKDRKIEFFGIPQLTAMLVVTFADGEEMTVATDTDWTCGGGNITYADLYMGEIYDARVTPARDRGCIRVSAPSEDTIMCATELQPIKVMRVLEPVSILVGGGALSGSATLNLVDDKLTAQGRGIVTNYGSSYKVSGHTLDWSFNVDVTNLTEYSFDDIVAEGKVDAQEKWVENYGANEMDRLMYAIIYQRTAIDSTVSKAVSLFALINTDEGLVLTFSRKDGTVEKFKTGITHENGVKTSLPVNIVIHGDDSADIYVDGEKIGTLSDAKSDSANTSDAHMFVTNTNYGCLYFAYRRETSAEKPMDVDISKATINIGVYEEQIEELTVATQVDSTGDIKLAYVQESEVAENKYDVRLIATINTIDAKVAGFKVALNSNEVTRETDTVYSSILANVNGDIKQINAADGEYFVALTITGVPATGTYTFEVTPYFTYANETTEGTTYEVTYTDGVFVSCVAAAN